MSFADTNDYGYTDKEPTQAAPPSKGEQLGRLINEKVKDPFHDGDVVKFVVLARYEYHYAALRAGGKWYPTGSSSLVPSGPLTYRRFVEEVLNREDVTGIEISTGWEPVQ